MENKLFITTCVRSRKAAAALPRHLNTGRQVQRRRTLQAKQEHPFQPARSNVIQARLPSFNELLALRSQMNEDVFRQKLEQLLTNMNEEKRLTSLNVSLPPGKIQEILDDITKIKTYIFRDKGGKVYLDPEKADTNFKPADLENLHSVLGKAQQVVIETMRKPDWLSLVFGGDYVGQVIEKYNKICEEIGRLVDDSGENLRADYNRDVEELGIGGGYQNGKLHFGPDICIDTPENKITIIHECAHLSDATILDKGYGGFAGFYRLLLEDKITNAAHYEVVPSWVLGMSKYEQIPFVPLEPEAVSEEGKVSNDYKDQGLRAASEYFRKIWDKMVNLHILLRNSYVKKEKIDEGKLNELSEHLGLTVHSNQTHELTILDITLMEDMTRTISLMVNLFSDQDCEILKKNLPEFTNIELYKNLFIERVLELTAGRQGVDRGKLDYIDQLS